MSRPICAHAATAIGLTAFAIASSSSCRPRGYNPLTGEGPAQSNDPSEKKGNKTQAKVASFPSASPTARTVDCRVIIAGGTTAGTAAAISAAQELERLGIPGNVCLLEPTDWPGGQLTAEGVAAVDFDHHSKTSAPGSVNLTTKRANNAKTFASWMVAMGTEPEGENFTMEKNRGRCWVSVRCYEPRFLVQKIKAALISPQIIVSYNTVVKNVGVSGARVTSVTAVKRTPKRPVEANGTYPDRLSDVLADWYSPVESEKYQKERVEFRLTSTGGSVIDATSWGEVMALSGADYVQGNTTETCGQSIVYPLALEIAPSATPLPAYYLAQIANRVTAQSKASYSHENAGRSWKMNWTYRRMRSSQQAPSVGDVTQINVGPGGNDYDFAYLFLTKAEARAQAEGNSWAGGVRIPVLADAEVHSLGYLEFLRRSDGTTAELHHNVTTSLAMGTEHGLSKMPYMRDTRRSVGVGGFQMSAEDTVSGRMYVDRVAIGLYAIDLHLVQGCGSKPRLPNPAPFSIPLRALTNRSLTNLLVAGKTMAQDFLTNAATRLHPIEFSSGTAAGVLAGYLAAQKTEVTTEAVAGEKERYEAVQTAVQRYTPVDWAP